MSVKSRVYKVFSKHQENAHSLSNAVASTTIKLSHGSSSYLSDCSGYVAGSLNILVVAVNWMTDYAELLNHPERYPNKKIMEFINSVYIDSDFHKIQDTDPQKEVKEKGRKFVESYVDNFRLEYNQNTCNYIKSRKFKTAGKKIIILSLTPALKFIAGINPASVSTHGDSLKNSVCHLDRLQKIQEKIPSNEIKLKKFLGAIITIKKLKAANKTVNLIWSCVPGSGAIGVASDILGVIKPIVDAATKKIEDKIIKNKLSKLNANVITVEISELEDAAKYIHYIAFKEQFRNRFYQFKNDENDPFNHNSNGFFGLVMKGDNSVTTGNLAIDIFSEILEKRGLSRVLGKYDIERIINEPMGWKVLLDKLTI